MPEQNFIVIYKYGFSERLAAIQADSKDDCKKKFMKNNDILCKIENIFSEDEYTEYKNLQEKVQGFINFEKNSNHKLSGEYFIMIRPQDFELNLMERYQIRVDGRYLCQADVIGDRCLTLEEVVDAGYNLLSCGKPKKEFMEDFQKRFGGKKLAFSDESIVKVYFLKKVIQLELFK